MLFMARMVVASSAPGSIVECGCFTGGSTSVLSVAAKRSGRKLHVFDSFSGLPEPDEADAAHHVLSDSSVHRYAKGAFNASLASVQQNVAKFGAIDACSFWPGYFEDTLPKFSERVAAVFCDVDLVSSIKTCLLYLWPLLSDGGIFFTHEAHHVEVAKLFFDDCWWQKHLNQSAPGLIGAGSGLGIGFRKNKDGYHGSCLGFVVKNPKISQISDETTR